MATAYARPPAANYHSLPQRHPHVQRTTRVCDSCGAVERNGCDRFRICGGCLCAVYCSENCQKMVWNSHRPTCRFNAAQMALAEQQGSDLYGDSKLSQHLRKFVSRHEELIQWAAVQALEIKRAPFNMTQKALVIVLDHRPHPKSLLQFTVKQAQTTPLDTLLRDSEPTLLSELQQREARSRARGGLGALVVIVQCGGIIQVVPVEVPCHLTWDSRDDWEPTLRKFVSEGRTDFKPISTTSHGVIYG